MGLSLFKEDVAEYFPLFFFFFFIVFLVFCFFRSKPFAKTGTLFHEGIQC